MIFDLHIKSIVFDLDGVLWRSSAIHAAAYKTVLERAGIAMPDYASIAGRRTDEVMRELLAAEGAASEAAAALTREKQRLARNMLAQNPPVDAACAEVLRELGRTRRLALASSASAGTVDLFLETSGTRALFKAVVTGDDVAAAKPDPAIYRAAVERLGSEVGETAVVEDAVNGIEAALRAGVAFVVALEGTTTAACLEHAGARHVVQNLTELLP